MHRGLALCRLTRQHADKQDLHPKQVPSLLDVERLGRVDNRGRTPAQLLVVLLESLLLLLHLELIVGALEHAELLLAGQMALVELVEVAELVVVVLEVGVEEGKGRRGLE